MDHELQLEEGMEETVPEEIANRAYHAMVYKEGVCYDYAAAFALLVRYIGMNSFVHIGVFLLETGNKTPCHHGWAELLIDGNYYIFDPQRESRMCNSNETGIKNYYFGIRREDAWRYVEPEVEGNEVRDAVYMSVSRNEKNCFCGSQSYGIWKGQRNGRLSYRSNGNPYGASNG